MQYPRVRKIHGLSDADIEDFVKSIQQVALVVEVDAAKSVRITRDKDDDPVIDTAIRTKANYIAALTKISVQRMSSTIAKRSGWKSSPIQC
jgi:putative PIN family toxin of toxin-antitoxin system